jgi:hypothetical protein
MYSEKRLEEGDHRILFSRNSNQSIHSSRYDISEHEREMLENVVDWEDIGLMGNNIHGNNNNNPFERKGDEEEEDEKGICV